MKTIGKCGSGTLPGCGHTITKKYLFIFNKELLDSTTISDGDILTEMDVGLCPNCGSLILRKEITDKDIQLLLDI